MSREDIFNKLVNICVDVFEVDSGSINDNSNLIEDFGCDSLKKLIFINEINNIFSISIELDETMNMNSIKDVVDVIERHL